MKKVILLALILLTGVPISCFFSKNTPGQFRIESLAIAAGEFSEYANRNSFVEKAFDPAPIDTMNSSDLVIQIRIDETSIIAFAAPLSFISSTYAGPYPPSSESKLSLISIYSEKSVFAGGEEYDVGDNLSNLFSASFDTDPSKILDFVRVSDDWYQGDNLYLTLSERLDQPLAQSLLIDVTLENGTVFNLRSSKIVVKEKY